MSEAKPTLLSIEDLAVEFRTRDGVVKALESVSFDVRKGETVGIVGESGSGKSVTALAIMGILPSTANIASGRGIFGGFDLLAATETERREYRGRELAMIFQNPRTALNPIRPVGAQIRDVLARHANMERNKTAERAVELLAQVKIPEPARRFHAYPFELSGGTCQRVMIAIAIACAPALLIADEPTTGLDVTTQAEILDLIKAISAQRQMATLLITHDLASAAEYCDRIVVMHAGHVVESAPTVELFARPRHPYTARLIASMPCPEVTLADLLPIPGSVPDPRRKLPPCRYRSRCEQAVEACDDPPLPRVLVGPHHNVACRMPL